MPAAGPPPVRSSCRRSLRGAAGSVLHELRDRPFEIVVDGVTPADDAGRPPRSLGAHADAGATWWLEADWANNTPESLRARILAGPPRIG